MISTSDAREKTPFRPLPQGLQTAAARILAEVGLFQWKESVSRKGEAARWHIGIQAQRVKEILEEEGEDPDRYGLFCETRDGEESRLALRMDQLLILMLSAIFNRR